MNLTMKNTLKTFAGIAVLGSALFMQSFTEKSRVAKAEKLAGEVWVNEDPNTASYQQLPASEPFDSNNCETADPTCAYERTEKPGTVPSTFDSNQADSLEAEGLIEAIGTTQGVYVH